jgi:hypothetical protein
MYCAQIERCAYLVPGAQEAGTNNIIGLLVHDKKYACMDVYFKYKNTLLKRLAYFVKEKSSWQGSSYYYEWVLLSVQ